MPGTILCIYGKKNFHPYMTGIELNIILLTRCLDVDCRKSTACVSVANDQEFARFLRSRLCFFIESLKGV